MKKIFGAADQNRHLGHVRELPIQENTWKLSLHETDTLVKRMYKGKRASMPDIPLVQRESEV